MLSGCVTKKMITKGKQGMGIPNHMIGIVSSKEGRECLLSGRYHDVVESTRNDSCQSRNRHLTPLQGCKIRKCRLRLNCDGTRAETRFSLSAKRTGGHQFSRLLAAEVCASAVVMLDTPCSEVVLRVLATHSIR